ncbi:hypothetical protein ACSSVZ_005432 [Amorphus sp. MBR-141]
MRRVDRVALPRSAIEEDLVGFLRQPLPADTRLVHGLVIDGYRADVVAVLEDRLLAFLIRDRRESLNGLGDAVRAIAEVASAITIVAHRRHFEETPCGGGRVRLAWLRDHRPARVWGWPVEPHLVADGCSHLWTADPSWSAPVSPRQSPWRMLELLERDELKAIAGALDLAGRPSATKPELMARIAWRVPAVSIWRSVCGALRRRAFPDADPPVGDGSS